MHVCILVVMTVDPDLDLSLPLLQVAAVRGCIPVIMMDGVKSEFEEQLPLKEYALRIPLYMAFRTPGILKYFIDSGRAAQMQVRGSTDARAGCVWVWIGVCAHWHFIPASSINLSRQSFPARSHIAYATAYS